MAPTTPVRDPREEEESLDSFRDSLPAERPALRETTLVTREREGATKPSLAPLGERGSGRVFFVVVDRGLVRHRVVTCDLTLEIE